jgi:Flp pilus assembly protein TadG
VYRFFERNNLVKRRVTHQQNTLDEQEIGRLKIDFVQAMRETIATFNVSRDCVLNMDETPVYYDPEINSTFAEKGSKKVSSKKTATTSKCSALLTVTIAGTKLVPFVVFIALLVL